LDLVHAVILQKQLGLLLPFEFFGPASRKPSMAVVPEGFWVFVRQKMDSAARDGVFFFKFRLRSMAISGTY